MSVWLSHIRSYWRMYLLRFMSAIVFFGIGIVLLNRANPGSGYADLGIGVFGAAIGIFIDIVFTSFIAPIQAEQVAKEADEKRIAELAISLAHNSSEIAEIDNQINVTYLDMKVVEDLMPAYQQNPTEEGMKVLDFHIAQWETLIFFHQRKLKALQEIQRITQEMGNSLTLIEQTGYKSANALVKQAMADVAFQEIQLEEFKNLKASLVISIGKIQNHFELTDNFQKLLKLYEKLGLHLHGSDQSDDENADIEYLMGDDLLDDERDKE